jgi:N-acetylmuramoyl-L-alanine amidase
MLIYKDYNSPKGDIVLLTGDELIVSFAATPLHTAWFSIPGVVDSVPMGESAPQSQSLWGEAVFGAGAVPDSLLVRGIYTGYWKVTPNARIDTSQIIYNLAPPSPWQILSQIFQTAFDSNAVKLTKYLKMKSLPKISSNSSYRVTLNSPDYPFAVRLKDSVSVLRHGPQKGYQSIHQPKDIELLVVGSEKPWHKIKLSKSQFAWVHDTSIVKIGKGLKPPISYLKTIRTKSAGRKLSFEFPLSGKHSFRIYEDDRKTLRVQLFGVITDTDWIRFDFKDSLIDLVTWTQPEEELYEVKIQLNQKIWGYDTYYKGNTFFLDIIKPPEKVKSFKNKIIVIDPGHSPDPGSIGPTGYTEAEANLAIALAIKNKLESRGAKVIMTRMDASNLPLYERPVIAKLNNADMFVSVHNNALPDGVNPWTNNGTSTYYYHPHSIDLGRSIHKEMLKATMLPDHGFYHGNLAVNRPTQYPAVLIECAFMLIPEQEAMLKTDAFRKRVADAVTRGIENFLKDFDRD